MPRKRITEFKAKEILFKHLNIPYSGISLNAESSVPSVDNNQKYVIKVDQGVKKRFKRGLIGVNISSSEFPKFIEKFKKEGFTKYLVEKYLPHESGSERYISIERMRDGFQIIYSEKGGIDIEQNPESLVKILVTSKDIKSQEEASKLIGISGFIQNLIKAMESEFISFLEINPLVIVGKEYFVLDLAMEVDSTAQFFVDSWEESDLLSDNLSELKSIEEEAIEKLSEKSTASFRLNVLNPNGSIFMLLSGGGASIVAADEVYQLGLADEIANYGEYSGGPSTEETYIYTKNVLNIVLKSKAKKKVIIIAAGVANFTDVYKTFLGIIQAMEERSNELKSEGVKVFVRRGGPNEKKGLKIMKEFLELNGLVGSIKESTEVMTDVVVEAVDYLK